MEKENYFYAQLDSENICIATSSLSGEVIADNMIRLEIMESEIMGKKWKDGEWLEVPQPELASTEKRELDYRTRTHKEDGTALIEYRGVLYTCDSAFAQMKIYEEESKYSENSISLVQELGTLWVEGKEYIRSLYK